jgi:hypothetical protein
MSQMLIPLSSLTNKVLLLVREEIRAPRKNWDANFVPQGGTSLEQLKTSYPELYGITIKEKETPTATDEDLEGLHEEQELEETIINSIEEHEQESEVEVVEEVNDDVETIH